MAGDRRPAHRRRRGARLAYGREVWDNSIAVVDLAKLTGRVPGWAVVGVPAVAVVLVAGVTAYLAFGRHLAAQVVGLAVVVVALAAPGFALGWTNGTVGVVGQRTAEVRQVVEKTRRSSQRRCPARR